jgi:hypothetical protein
MTTGHFQMNCRLGSSVGRDGRTGSMQIGAENGDERLRKSVEQEAGI